MTHILLLVFCMVLYALYFDTCSTRFLSSLYSTVLQARLLPCSRRCLCCVVVLIWRDMYFTASFQTHRDTALLVHMITTVHSNPSLKSYISKTPCLQDPVFPTPPCIIHAASYHIQHTTCTPGTNPKKPGSQPRLRPQLFCPCPMPALISLLYILSGQLSHILHPDRQSGQDEASKAVLQHSSATPAIYTPKPTSR